MRLVVLAHGPMLEGVSVDRRLPNPGIGGTQFTRLRLAQEFAARFPEHEVEVVSDQMFSLTPELPNLRMTFAVDLEGRLGVLASEGDGWVLTGPSMLLRGLRTDILRPLASRTIVTSHLMFDADLWEIERDLRFGAVGCVSIHHYHSTRSRAPRVYLRDLFLPGWPQAPWPRQDLAAEPRRTFRIVHVGALLPLKGFDDLARLWPQIRSAIPTARLDVIGGSSTYGRLPDHPLIPTTLAFGDRILAHIPPADIEEGRVVFHGNLGADKTDVIRRADVAVLNVAGREESLNAALIECLDLGVPVIGSDRFGLWDSMRHFPELATRSPAEVVERLARFAAAPELSGRFSERALEVARGFRAENDAIIDRWRDVAEALLEHRRPPDFAPQAMPGSRWRHLSRHLRKRARYEVSQAPAAGWVRRRRGRSGHAAPGATG